MVLSLALSFVDLSLTLFQSGFKVSTSLTLGRSVFHVGLLSDADVLDVLDGLLSDADLDVADFHDGLLSDADLDFVDLKVESFFLVAVFLVVSFFTESIKIVLCINYNK